MKKVRSKAEIRDDLERATARFLGHGGEVEAIPKGISGRDPDSSEPPHTRRLFVEPRSPRTPLTEVVAAIEARRKSARKQPAKVARSRPPKPRRKMLYDDFGEPLRRVWVDE